MHSFFHPIRDDGELLAAVKIGVTTESIHLDFKSDITQKRDGLLDVAVDVAAFANTWGGTLLFGIREDAREDGRRVAGQILGVDFERVRKKVTQAINNHVHPPSIGVACNVIGPLKPGVVLLAVNVSASERLVAAWDNGKHVLFPYRTNEGNAYMSPTEILERSSLSARAGEIKLRRAVERSGAKHTYASDGVRLESAFVTVVSSMLQVQNGAMANPTLRRQRPIVKLGALFPHEFRLDIIVTESLVDTMSLPYGLVQEAWYSEGSIRLILSRQLVRTAAFGWFVE